MNKRMFLSLAIMLVFGSCYSQSDYRKGYIINVSNDTVSGYINYKGSLKKLRKLRFKRNLEDEYIEYSTEDVNTVRFDESNLYVSLEVEIDGVAKRYFVEQLIDGIVDVFFLPVKNGSFFLIRTEKGEVFELKNTESIVQVGNAKYTKYKKEYVEVLKDLFQDSPETLEKINQLEYHRNSMIDIAENYHNNVCSEYACKIYTKEKLRMDIDFALYAGITNSSISFYDNENTPNLNKNYSSSKNPVFGFYVNFMDPNISERFSAQLDLFFTGGNYTSGLSNIDISFLKIPISLKYTYPVKKLKPSIWLGIAYNKWNTFEDENVVPDHLSGNAIQKRRHQYGLHTGVEVSVPLSQKIDLLCQVKYENYTGKHLNKWVVPSLTVQDIVKSKTTFLSFSVGLKF